MLIRSSLLDSVPLMKFPRTSHLYDAGGSGVARDDLLLDPADVKVRYQTVGLPSRMHIS
jgi:hypothetical protein